MGSEMCIRDSVIPGLVAVNVVFAGLLTWQWVTPQGELRNVRWAPPAPIAPVLTDAVLPLWSVDLGSFMVALDRPLFSSTRKPPAKPEPPPPVPIDTLAGARVLGLYTSAGTGGGALVRLEGKPKRLRIGDDLAGWTVKEIKPLALVVARGDEIRALDLARGPDIADLPPSKDGSAAGQNANSATAKARLEGGDSTSRVNAMRARAGLPLLP